jgi:hypothetical protein
MRIHSFLRYVRRVPTKFRTGTLGVALALTTACVIFEGEEHLQPPSRLAQEAGDGDAPRPTDAAPDATDASSGPGPDAARARVVFVTHAVRTGDLGGIAGADAICNAEAAANGVPGSFIAYLHRGGGDSGHPARRLASDGGWSRVDGIAIFEGNPRTVLPAVPLDVTADAGRLAAGERVWTGLYGGPSSICGAGGGDVWSTAAPAALPGAGWGDPKAMKSSTWHLRGTLAACADRLHLYCFEQ